MNPYKLKDVFKYLTSNNQLLKKKLKLGTSEMPIPPKRQDVTNIEAINRFNKANPRVDATNLKPISVKQSNVGQADKAVVQDAVSKPILTLDPEKDSFKKISNVLGAYKKYRRGEKNPKLNFNKFFELYSTENFAEGGRAGYEDGGMLVKPSDDGSRPGYMGKNVMSGSPAQQAENIRRENESFKKISELFKKKDYTGLKTKTPVSRIEKGLNDGGGKLNSIQMGKITKAIDGGEETQKALAKKLGITKKELLEGVEKSKSKIATELSESMKKMRFTPDVQLQQKMFYEILENSNATVQSMAKKFKVSEKEITKKSSQLLKNVYTQNVAITKTPAFDIDSRGKATLKSWLPDQYESTKNFLNNFSAIDGLKKVQTENMGILLANAYRDQPKKYAEAMKTLTAYNDFKNNLPKGMKVDLDHPLSKEFIKGSGASPDKLLYVSPVDRGFNRGFKKQIGDRYSKALLQGDKTAIKNIRTLADKVGVNIGDVKGSKLDFGTTKFDKNKNFALEYFNNLKEQNLVADNLKNLQKTTEGKQLIKDANFKSGQIKEVQKINKTAMKKVMAFCPAGTVKVTKAGGGRVPYADGPVCTPEEAIRGMNEEIDKIKKGKATAGQTSRTLNKLKTIGSIGMGGLLKAGLVSEVLYEAAIGFDKVISEGQSPIQAFRQSYLTAPLRAVGALKSFEEGEREELLDIASDKGKVGRVLDLQETVLNRDKLINKINNLETSLEDQQALYDGDFGYMGGSTEPLEKNITELKAQLQDSYRDGQVNRADELFSTKPQDLKIKDQSLMDAYNNAIEKRAVKQASNSLKAQSIAADDNRLRKANKTMIDLGGTYQDYKNPFTKDEYENFARQEGYLPIDKAYTDKYFTDAILNPMKFEQLMETPGFKGASDKFASGGLASLTDTIPPESGPTPQGLPYVYNNVKKI